MYMDVHISIDDRINTSKYTNKYTHKEFYDSLLACTDKFTKKNYVIMDKVIQGYLMTLDQRFIKYGKI
jgi:hypothetical protein